MWSSKNLNGTTTAIIISHLSESTSSSLERQQHQQPSPTHSLNIANIPIRRTPRRAIIAYQAQRTRADIMKLKEEIMGLERMLGETWLRRRELAGLELPDGAANESQTPQFLAEMSEGASFTEQQMRNPKGYLGLEEKDLGSREEMLLREKGQRRVSGATVWDREIEDMNTFLREGRKHMLEEMVGKKQKMEIEMRVGRLGLEGVERDGGVVWDAVVLEHGEARLSKEDVSVVLIKEDEYFEQSADDWESVSSGGIESLICVQEKGEDFSVEGEIRWASRENLMEEMEYSVEDEIGCVYGNEEIEIVKSQEIKILDWEDLTVVRRDCRTYESEELKDGLADSTKLMDIEESGGEELMR